MPKEGDNKGYRNIIALGFVSLFTDISSEMVFGILPSFIVSDLGASRAFLGLIEGTGEMLSYGFRMVSGTFSDTTGKRKPFVLIGYALSAVSKPFFGLSSVWTDALVVRSADRVGKGLRTAPRDALISDSIPAEKVGRAFGIHRSLDQIGAIIGPIIGFVIFPLIGMRGIFYVSLIPATIALIILLAFVRERSVTPRSKAILVNIGSVLHGKFVVLLIFIGIFAIGAFNFSFVLLRTTDLGIHKEYMLIVYTVINAAHTAIGIPSGILSDRIGKERVLIIGYIIFFLSSVLMIYGTNILFAYLLAVIYGLYVGITETVQRAIIPKYVPSELRGTAYGVYNIIVGICFLAANIIFGLLWDQSGVSTAAMYSMITSITAIAGLALVFRK